MASGNRQCTANATVGKRHVHEGACFEWSPSKGLPSIGFSFFQTREPSAVRHRALIELPIFLEGPAAYAARLTYSRTWRCPTWQEAEKALPVKPKPHGVGEGPAT
jgi:hypothetical protein